MSVRKRVSLLYIKKIKKKRVREKDVKKGRETAAVF